MTSPILPRITRAPKFQGLGPWHNAEPRKLSDLRGKVVLVDFWAYSCINCIRTLSYIQGYWEKFKDTGSFVLIGVHTPEFTFEKLPENVAAAIKRHGLTYPVAQDNDFGTWNAFTNHYWPAKYLIDAEGYIRYTHFGEGAYEETEEAITSLLGEIGVQPRPSPGADSAEGGEQRFRDLTPETYLGARSWPSLVNGSRGPTDEVTTYELPDTVPLHRFALGGTWQMKDTERQVLVSEEGEIRMRFLGGEINLVLGMNDPDVTPHVSIEVDGEFVKEFDLAHHDLRDLFTGEYGEHEITLSIRGKGLAAYAFTFGS